MAPLPAGPTELLRPRGFGRASAALAGVLLLVACQGTGPVFVAGEREDLVWPSPPEPARLRFAGMVSADDPARPSRGGAAGIADVLFGAPEPERLHGPRAAVRTPDLRTLWVADPGGRVVQVLDLEAGGHRRLSAAGEIPFRSPVGLALGPEGSVFVCDSERVAIDVFDAGTAEFRRTLTLPPEVLRPVAVAFDEGRRELFVVDVVAHDVKVLREDGTKLAVLGTRGNAPGTFNFPCAIALFDGELWIADAGNYRVQALRRDGSPRLAIGSPGNAPGDLAMPKGVALDSDGHVYVVDARFENVQVFDRQGRLLTVFGGEGTAPGRFWLPSGITIDRADRIWVCDSYNHRVQAFDYLRLPNTGEPGEAPGPWADAEGTAEEKR